ncbi:MAG TPA: RNA 2',3'-cyclic phosphodiesterase [Steroidobacteraceae bacterium]|nr:RNA 2',3'-cyclic phosphodiesterase [Steroidobacteraceae bacterium]
MLRLFFALQPSPGLGAGLLESSAPLLTQLQVPAVPAGNLHATLCFVGAVAPERLDALRAAAATVRCAPVTLDFDAYDFWDKPRVLCACVSRESVAAIALSEALRDASIAAGFAPDAKPFRAHLTLARKISPTEAEKISWPQKISPGFVVRCDRFVLMESRREEHGSIYSVVDEWPLYAKEEC